MLVFKPISFTIILVQFSSIIAATCYLPNGRVTNHFPCDTEVEVTHCCGHFDDCLSNGLCGQKGTGPLFGIGFARGTCTDQSWDSPFCPQVCLRNQNFPEGYDFSADGVQVWECGSEGYSSQASYCCESNRESTRCCSTSTAVFVLPGATIGAIPGAVTKSTTSSSATTRIRSNFSPVSTPISAFTFTSSPNQAARPSNNDSAKIGGAVSGVVVGLILIAIAIVLILRRRKMKEQEGIQIPLVKSSEWTQLGDGQMTHELHASSVSQELPAQSMPHELSGTSQSSGFRHQ